MSEPDLAKMAIVPGSYREERRDPGPAPYTSEPCTLYFTREALPRRTGYPCDSCGTPMIELHCKLACPNCGAKADCSDP